MKYKTADHTRHVAESVRSVMREEARYRQLLKLEKAIPVDVFKDVFAAITAAEKKGKFQTRFNID